MSHNLVKIIGAEKGVKENVKIKTIQSKAAGERGIKILSWRSEKIDGLKKGRTLPECSTPSPKKAPHLVQTRSFLAGLKGG